MAFVSRLRVLQAADEEQAYSGSSVGTVTLGASLRPSPGARGPI